MQEASWINHLIELRTRLIRAFFGWILIWLALLVWPGTKTLYELVAKPMLNALPVGSQMIATGIVSPLLIPIKISLLVALVCALPWLLYQAWAFIAPGLYQHEKNKIVPLIVSSTLLFILGTLFCYFFVFGHVFSAIYQFAPSSMTIAPDIENYLDFVMSMCLAFGMSFEIPVIIWVLVRTNVVDIQQLRNIRRYVIVAIAVISAIITPPDAISMLSLAVPMWLLYELGIWVTVLLHKNTA